MIFDRYLLKSLTAATVFTAMTLAAIILLTQSLRFLELVIESGASSLSFWILTSLALPRFFEIILPIALMISTVFIYNRMSLDSEIVVMRAAGFSPLRLSRPALALAAIVTALLLLITTWLAPVSFSNMQHLRQVIKAQYSALLFREGVFNTLGDNLTLFIRDRAADGALEGLMIHDTRGEDETPVTILAKRGMVVADETGSAQVLVFDGSRQDYNPETGVLNRLDFERYTIDLPESGPVRQRWREPDERTLWELLSPSEEEDISAANRHQFFVEANRRLISPFLALTFTVMALAALLLGPIDRRGQGRRIVIAVATVITIQGFYLALFNIADNHIWGLALVYILVLAPLAGGLFLLSPKGERFRHRLLYGRNRE